MSNFSQQDIEDLERFRWLAEQAKEELINPKSLNSEFGVDLRTYWKLPTLICSGPIGGFDDFRKSIDNLRLRDNDK